MQWGKPDTLSLLKSQLEEPARPTKGLEEQSSSESKTYFTADIDPELISIIQNDWPYSGISSTLRKLVTSFHDVLVPLEVEHSLVWTKLPILPPPSLLIPSIAESLSPELREIISARLAQDGLWGFTGSIEPPPSPSLLPQSLGALSEWGITMDKLVVSARGAEDEELAIKRSGAEVQAFVANRWSEREWETCWFVNPPVRTPVVLVVPIFNEETPQRLQSVKGLAHIHVFARKKRVWVK